MCANSNRDKILNIFVPVRITLKLRKVQSWSMSLRNNFSRTSRLLKSLVYQIFHVLYILKMKCQMFLKVWQITFSVNITDQFFTFPSVENTISCLSCDYVSNVFQHWETATVLWQDKYILVHLLYTLVKQNCSHSLLKLYHFSVFYRVHTH
jgi:hypothetical protein